MDKNTFIRIMNMYYGPYAKKIIAEIANNETLKKDFENENTPEHFMDNIRRVFKRARMAYHRTVILRNGHRHTRRDSVLQVGEHLAQPVRQRDRI